MSEGKRTDILIVDDLPEKHLIYRVALEDLDRAARLIAAFVRRMTPAVDLVPR